MFENRISLLADSTSKSSSTSTSYDKMANLDNKRRHIPSASSALVIGSILGIVQTLFLIFSAKPILNYMGVKPVSSVFFGYALIMRKHIVPCVEEIRSFYFQN